jgi:hypothetical protein
MKTWFTYNVATSDSEASFRNWLPQQITYSEDWFCSYLGLPRFANGGLIEVKYIWKSIATKHFRILLGYANSFDNVVHSSEVRVINYIIISSRK